MLKDIEIEEMSLLITERCNFNCPFCYVRQKEIDMAEEIGKKSIDLLLNSKGKNKVIHFFGGEPLLRPNFISMLSKYAQKRSLAIKKGVHFKITTNGSLMDNKIKNFLRENGFEIVLSIHKDREGKFTHIVKNKKFFQTYPNLKISITLYPGNLDEQFSFIRYIYQNNLTKKLNISPAMGYPWDEVSVSKLGKVYTKVIDSYFKGGIQNIAIENFENKINYPVNQSVSPFRKEILVLPGGDMVLCNFILSFPRETIKHFVVGNVNRGIDARCKKYCYYNNEPKKRFPLNYCDEECSKHFLNEGRALTKKEVYFLTLARGRMGELINSETRKYCLFPSFHLITLTEKCSQNCLYCYADKSNKKLSEHKAEKILSFIFKNSPKRLNIFFQANEPLHNFNLIKKLTGKARLLEKVYNKQNVDITLFSNLSDMDKEKLEFILKENIYVHTSLDGPREVHEKNRPGSNFDELLYWIKAIKDNGGNIKASVVITKYSLPKFKEIVDVYAKLNLHKISLRSIMRLGLAKRNWKKIDYTPKHFLDFWRNSLHYILFLNKKGIKLVEERTLIILKKILGIKDVSTFFSSPPCSGIEKQVAYDTEGNIYPCDEARSANKFKLGNVNSINLILKSDIKKPFAAKFKNDAVCSTGPLCSNCFVLDKEANEFRYNIYKNQIKYIKTLLKHRRYRVLLGKWLKYA